MNQETRPLSVKRFERLIYLSTAVTLFSAPFRPDVTDAFTEVFDQVPRSVFALFVGVVLSLTLLTLGPVLLLIWLAARRHKNWARWSLLVFFVATPFFLFWQPLQFDRAHAFATSTDILAIVLEAAAYCFAFSPSANAWYRASANNAAPY